MSLPMEALKGKNKRQVVKDDVFGERVIEREADVRGWASISLSLIHI